MTVSASRLLCVGGPLHGKRWHAHDGAATFRTGRDLEREHEYRTVSVSLPLAAASIDVLALSDGSLDSQGGRLLVDGFDLYELLADAQRVEADRLAAAAWWLYIATKRLAAAESEVGGALAAFGFSLHERNPEVARERLAELRAQDARRERGGDGEGG